MDFFVLYPVIFTGYFYIMKLYEAIKKMRQLTAEGKSFSMAFMSLNMSEMKSEGVVDLDKGEARQFYLPLLMMFNGEKITIR